MLCKWNSAARQMHCKPSSCSDSDPTPVRGSGFPGTEGRARSGASVSVPTRSIPQPRLHFGLAAGRPRQGSAHGAGPRDRRWLAGCEGRGARAPTLPGPVLSLCARLVGPRRSCGDPEAGPGWAGAGARPGRGRGRNAPVLRRAVGLAVGCAVHPLPRPVRGIPASAGWGVGGGGSSGRERD